MTSPPVNEHTTGPGTAPQNPANQMPQQQTPPQQTPPQQHVVKRTRVGGVWVASALFAVVLLLLLIFILENGQRVDIGYFGAHGHLPLGVALLLAAVLGVLLVVIPGTGRIVQLRLVARRHHRLDATRGDAVGQPVAADQPVPPGQPVPPDRPPSASQPAPPAGYQP